MREAAEFNDASLHGSVHDEFKTAYQEDLYCFNVQRISCRQTLVNIYPDTALFPSLIAY